MTDLWRCAARARSACEWSVCHVSGDSGKGASVRSMPDRESGLSGSLTLACVHMWLVVDTRAGQYLAHDLLTINSELLLKLQRTLDGPECSRG